MRAYRRRLLSLLSGRVFWRRQEQESLGDKLKHKVLLIAALIILLFSTIYQANTVDRTDQLFWFSHSTLVTFTKELAFACLIAWIIINSVEANHRRRNENMTDRFLSQQLAKTEEFQNTIAKDVFAAVFSTRVTRQLVDAVVDQVLGTEAGSILDLYEDY